MSRRPNILFLMSDEHRADFTGYEGNSIVRTPVLDDLASSGVVFRNCYTPSPICVPSRQCLMAGQLPKTCQCEGWFDLEPGYKTFAGEFARYAYNTVCSGKLHHLGVDQMQGWTKRIAADSEVAVDHIPDRIEAEFERYQPAPGTGKWSLQREIAEARAEENGPYHKFDARAVRASLDYLDRYFDDAVYQRRQSHRPLLMKVSLLQPHFPFFTDQERFDYYYDRVPIFEELPMDHPVLANSQPGEVSPEQIRAATAAYYGMIEQIDSYYGQILEKLRSMGQDLDDWIIVYCSDHGEMLGQHGIWFKSRFYEASARVPLIIRWPKGFDGGRVVDENVNLCDLFATLCDLAGLDIPDGLDSRSMLPLLRGDASNWDNESISQFNDNHLMIKRDALKYQYYGEDIPEVLFDLEKNPQETQNFADDSAYEEAMTRFRNRRDALGHGPDANPNYVNAGY